ncbi:hypothetical protein CFOL_v3_16901 [Cephalotus follicularis]|uniref:Retrotransposon gag domain-containing protein n=1 Tax=Cephalotus follicularis TaxID=3775 RepID=A0A1Q3BZG8_CEPFO|nr:hypothetical protein CFOL_v3_16901 [Cephalotus follicularis]
MQGRDESLRDYLTRFNKESLTVKDLKPSFATAALSNGMRNNSSFTFSLLKRPALDMADLLRRAERYVNAEEEMVARKKKPPGRAIRRREKTIHEMLLERKRREGRERT